MDKEEKKENTDNIIRRNSKVYIQDMNILLDNLFLLIENYIIDYSLIEKLIQVMNSTNDRSIIPTFQTRYNIELKVKLSSYKSKNSLQSLIILQKMLIFFMIIVHNLKDLNKFKQIFKSNHPLIETLKNIMILFKESKPNAFICQIILNLFFDEYKEKFFSKEDDKELDEIYIKYFFEFSSIYSEAIDISNSKYYASMLENLVLFNIKEEMIKQKTFEENSAIGGRICENIIEIVLSKEKYAYINMDKDKDKDQSNDDDLVCFEIRFIQGILEKYIRKIKDDYGSIYNTLFRKEDFSNELIKNIFFSFGNSCFISAFLSPLHKYIVSFEKEITIDGFNAFFNSFLSELSKTFPMILKIVIKLIHNEIIKYQDVEKYKENEGEENTNDNVIIENNNNNAKYTPIMTMLMFNFFISPKMQDIYAISAQKYNSMRNVNRIIRNICFKSLFKEGDHLYQFNQTIETQYDNLVNFLTNDVLMVNIEDKDIQAMIKNTLNNNNISIPWFIFRLNHIQLKPYMNGDISNHNNNSKHIEVNCIKK